MKPIEKLPRKTCRRLDAVFSDLDDTLTAGGKLPPAALSALWGLSGAGLTLVIVTGRPAGWADALVRLLPVRHVIAENGALIVSHDPGRRTLSRWYEYDERKRKDNKEILEAVSRKILKANPGLTLAADQPYRETDIAFDLCEDRPTLDGETMARLESMLRAEGLTYKVSSIHVNAWVGAYTKRTACEKLLGKMAAEAGRAPLPLFIGDSPNDEPLFEAFELSVGVANIRAFAHRMKTLPAYVTGKDGPRGFVQMARHVLAMRRSTL
jgi:HAD superfamily hydrolase (TIGR01484 family)